MGDGKQMTMLKFKPRAKPENRRRTERHAVGGLAKIQLGTGSLPRDCLSLIHI